MSAEQWLALADEYYDLARQHQQAGNSEAARFWRRAGDACRAEARRIEAEHQPESRSVKS